MQKIKVQDALGSVLVHDLTQIIPGETKGARFSKGHKVKEEDIPVLLSMGKEHLYVWDDVPGLIHEDEAAIRLAKAVSGPGIIHNEPKEGKVNLIAEYNGLLYASEEGIFELNSLEYIVLATLHNHRPVKAGQKIAGTRVVPLMIEDKIIGEAEKIAAKYTSPLLKIIPLKKYKVGIVVTGSEVYHGRIEDKFSPVLKSKIENWGSESLEPLFSNDDVSMIQEKIKDQLKNGAEIILVTGGMSVDPDDVTPTAIKELGAELITYGSPVLPGAMFLLAYLDEIPVMGLPGCVMFSKTTVFDLVAPRILAGERVSRKDIAKFGVGGLCLECPSCTYPHCPFGK